MSRYGFTARALVRFPRRQLGQSSPADRVEGSTILEELQGVLVGPFDGCLDVLGPEFVVGLGPG